MMTISRWLTGFLPGMLGGSLHVFEDFERCQTSRRAHNSAARMRRRATDVEVLDRRPEPRPPCNVTEEKQLLQREFTLKNVAFAEAELSLEIKRGDHLFVQDDVFDIGSVLGAA